MGKHDQESAAVGARRATGAATGRGRGGRFSAGRKRETVLRLLRGEDLDSVSRELGITAVFVVHLLALLRFLETRALGTAALAGVLAAASTFVRPVAYFWPFVATAIMLCTLRRAGIRGCATFLVLAVLPCVLWAVRNDVQGGYFGFSASSRSGSSVSGGREHWSRWCCSERWRISWSCLEARSGTADFGIR